MVDDDPVVKELDVFLSDSLASNIYVVQFPNRPTWNPLDPPNGARIRPKLQKLELSYELDVDGPTYDKDAPAHLKIEEQVLQSSRVPAASNYAVGVIRDGQLHITPVHGMLQMRPSFGHIDDAVDADVVEDDDEEEAKAKQAEAKPALQAVGLKRRESAAVTAQRESSTEWQQARERGDPWRQLSVRNIDSSAVEAEYEKLFAPQLETLAGAVAPAAYNASLSYLQPADGQGVGDETEAKVKSRLRAGDGGSGAGSVSAGAAAMVEARAASDAAASHLFVRRCRYSAPAVDLQTLRSRPLTQQVEGLLAAASVLPFAQLCSLLPQASDMDLVSTLEARAMLLRGYWVALSSEVAPSTMEVDCRDFILLELYKTGLVRREQLNDEPVFARLGRERTAEMLRTLAVLEAPQRRWRFKPGDQDTDFLNCFPAVASRQHALWVEREQQLQAAGFSMISPLLPATATIPRPVSGFTPRWGPLARQHALAEQQRAMLHRPPPPPVVVEQQQQQQAAAAATAAAAASTSKAKLLAVTAGVLRPGQRAAKTTAKSGAGAARPRRPAAVPRPAARPSQAAAAAVAAAAVADGKEVASEQGVAPPEEGEQEK